MDEESIYTTPNSKPLVATVGRLFGRLVVRGYLHGETETGQSILRSVGFVYYPNTAKELACSAAVHFAACGALLTVTQAKKAARAGTLLAI